MVSTMDDQEQVGALPASTPPMAYSDAKTEVDRLRVLNSELRDICVERQEEIDRLTLQVAQLKAPPCRFDNEKPFIGFPYGALPRRQIPKSTFAWNPDDDESSGMESLAARIADIEVAMVPTDGAPWDAVRDATLRVHRRGCEQLQGEFQKMKDTMPHLGKHVDASKQKAADRFDNTDQFSNCRPGAVQDHAMSDATKTAAEPKPAQEEPIVPPKPDTKTSTNLPEDDPVKERIIAQNDWLRAEIHRMRAESAEQLLKRIWKGEDVGGFDEDALKAEALQQRAAEKDVSNALCGREMLRKRGNWGGSAGVDALKKLEAGFAASRPHVSGHHHEAVVNKLDEVQAENERLRDENAKLQAECDRREREDAVDRRLACIEAALASMRGEQPSSLSDMVDPQAEPFTLAKLDEAIEAVDDPTHIAVALPTKEQVIRYLEAHGWTEVDCKNRRYRIWDLSGRSQQIRIARDEPIDAEFETFMDCLAMIERRDHAEILVEMRAPTPWQLRRYLEANGWTLQDGTIDWVWAREDYSMCIAARHDEVISADGWRGILGVLVSIENRGELEILADIRAQADGPDGAGVIEGDGTGAPAEPFSASEKVGEPVTPDATPEQIAEWDRAFQCMKKGVQEACPTKAQARAYLERTGWKEDRVGVDPVHNYQAWDYGNAVARIVIDKGDGPVPINLCPRMFSILSETEGRDRAVIFRDMLAQPETFEEAAAAVVKQHAQVLRRLAPHDGPATLPSFDQLRSYLERTGWVHAAGSEWAWLREGSDHYIAAGPDDGYGKAAVEAILDVLANVEGRDADEIRADILEER